MIRAFSKQTIPLKTKPKKSWYWRPVLAVSIIIVMIVLPAITFFAGVLAFPSFKVAFNPIVHTTGIDWRNKAAVVDTLKNLFKESPMNFLKAQLADAPPTLDIDIKFTNYAKLNAKRKQALKIGYLKAAQSDFVPAKITVKGKSVKVKIRLKGDLLDHVDSKKWSFRVHVKGDGHIFGLRRFSIQAPRVRSYQREPVYLDHLRREGVLAVRYFFVNVRLNGDKVGVMAIEEHFSKELLESQRRREGVIIKFNGDDWWDFKTKYSLDDPYRDYRIAEILPFRNKWVRKSQKRFSDYLTAVSMLRGFIDGRLSATQVFDAEILSRHLVLMVLWGTVHPQVFDNIRLYLNPITMRLEPIGFDGQPALNGIRLSPAVPTWSLYKKAFDDLKFKKIYDKELARIAEDVQSPEFSAWLTKREDRFVLALHRENPFVPKGLMKLLISRAKGMAKFDDDSFKTPIDNTLIPKRPPATAYPNLINAFFLRENKKDIVEIRNVVKEKIVIDGITVNGKNLKSFASDSYHPINFPISLELREYRQKIPTVRVMLPENGIASPDKKIIVESHVIGQKTRYQNVPIDYSTASTSSKLPASTLADILEDFPRFMWDEKARFLTIPEGEWLFSDSVVLPKGAGLAINAGATLKFPKGGIILLKGPLKIAGERKTPVVLKASATGQSWGGIAVLKSNKPSIISNAIFEDIEGIHKGNWSTTGAVNFFRSDITIRNSVLKNISAEDALNIVDSKFQISGCSFDHIRSDAIDLDFSNGSINLTDFNNVDGDGIDLSGSTVKIGNVTLDQIGDKAISVGEASRVQIDKFTIKNSSTGIVSKDLSITNVRNGRLENIRQAAFMAYVKKPEYGPAELIASDIETSNVGDLGVVQLKNTLTINGREIKPIDLDVDALYQSGNIK